MKEFAKGLSQDEKIGYLLAMHDPIIAATAKSLTCQSNNIRFEDAASPGNFGLYFVIERYLAEEIKIPGKANIAMNYCHAAKGAFYDLKCGSADALMQKFQDKRSFTLQEVFDSSICFLRDPANVKIVDDICRLFNTYVPCAAWHKENIGEIPLNMAKRCRHLSELCRIVLGTRPAVYLSFPYAKPHVDCYSFKDIVSGCCSDNARVIRSDLNSQLRMLTSEDLFWGGAILVRDRSGVVCSVGGIVGENALDELFWFHSRHFSACEITPNGYMYYFADDVDCPFWEEKYQKFADSLCVHELKVDCDCTEFASLTEREKVCVFEWYLLSHPKDFWAYVNLAKAFLTCGCGAVAESIVQQLYVNSVIKVVGKREILSQLFPSQICDRFILRIPWQVQEKIKQEEFIQSECGGAEMVVESDILWPTQEVLWKMPTYTPKHR